MTRIMLTAAILEEGETRIDRHAHLTVDKARHGGHFYSDKAPGMSLLALPAYAVGTWLATAVQGHPPEMFPHAVPVEDPVPAATRLVYRAMVLATNGVLTMLAGLGVWAMCLRLGASPRAALMTVLCMFLATPYLGWSVQFFGHAAAAAALILAFALSTGLGREPRRPGLRAGLAAGLLGLAVTVEYTAAPAAAMVAAYALWRLTRMAPGTRAGPLVAALLCGGLSIVPLLAYHTVSFGDPFSTGYASVVGFEGMSEGLLGVTSPDPVVLWKILLGFRRGILWLSPVLVLVPVGFWMGWKARRYRPELLLCALVIAYYFLLNASYHYWEGGASVGPRHVVPSLPFAGVLLMWVWQGAEGRLRQALWGLFGLGLFFSLATASMTMTVVLGYRFPLKDPILENLFTARNAFARHDWLGLPPLALFLLWLGLCGTLSLALWRTVDRVGRGIRTSPVRPWPGGAGRSSGP